MSDDDRVVVAADAVRAAAAAAAADQAEAVERSIEALEEPAPIEFDSRHVELVIEETTEPTPESALQLDLSAEPEAPATTLESSIEEVSPELSDTTFGRAVEDFAGDTLGEIVERADGDVKTAVMLGIGRAIGETMTVMMVTGNAARMPLGLDAFFRPVRTMTATIAAEMGEVANGSEHYHVLFTVGLVLFIFSFVVNLAAGAVVFQQRKRAERLLS